MQTETVTRLRAGTKVDAFAKPPRNVADWDAATGVDMETLAPAEPMPSAEPAETARNSVSTSWRLFLDAAEDVTAYDRMIVRGVTYDVIGTPALWAGAGLVVVVGKTKG